MARKERGFQWTRDEDDAAAREPAERPNRVQEKGENRALEALARRLTAMAAGERRRLPLSEKLLQEVQILSELGPKSSRRRQLLYVQRLLRASDVDAIHAALDNDTVDAAHGPALERWHRQLIAGGDGAIQAFVEAYPRADRQQLRGLCRRSQGEGQGPARARKELRRALLSVVVAAG